MICADVGGEDVAEDLVLFGAVAAALGEERLPGDLELWLVEDDPAPADHAETLALCLSATDLWSVVEAVAADAAVAAITDELDDDEYEVQWNAVLAREAGALLTRRHRRRLWLLVRRLRAELPITGFPEASEAIDRACAAFRRSRAVRARLAALLLTDTLGPLHPLVLPLPVRLAA